MDAPHITEHMPVVYSMESQFVIVDHLDAGRCTSGRCLAWTTCSNSSNTGLAP